MEGTAVSITLKDYKAQLEDLKGTLLGLDKDTEEYANTLNEINERQNKLNEVLQVTKTGYIAVDGSLAQMRKTLSDMTKDLNNNYVVGTKAYDEMAKKVKAYADQVKEAEAKQGVFFRNVGNYANSFTQAFQAMGMQAPNALKSVEVGLQGVQKGMSLLEKHPLIAAISVIVGLIMAVVSVLKKCYDAYASTAEGANRLSQAFSSLNGIGVVFQKVMQSIGKAIADVVIPVFGALAEVIITTTEWIGKLAEGIGKVTGNDTLKQVGEDMKNVRKEVEKSTEAERQRQKLAKQANELAVKASRQQIKIDELRAKANDRESYSIKERQKFAEEAHKLEQEILDEKIKIAQANLTLIKQENARAGSTKADLEKERQLEIEVNNLIGEKARNDRSYHSEQRSFAKEQQRDNSKAEKARDERAKAEQKYLEYLQKESQLMTEVYSKTDINNVKEQIKIREEAYKKELSEINNSKSTAEQKQKERLVALQRYNFDTLKIMKEHNNNVLKETNKSIDLFYNYYVDVEKKSTDELKDSLNEMEKVTNDTYNRVIKGVQGFYKKRKEIIEESLSGDELKKALESLKGEEGDEVVALKNEKVKRIQALNDKIYDLDLQMYKNQLASLKEYSAEWQTMNVDIAEKTLEHIEEQGPRVGETIEQWKARIIEAKRELDLAIVQFDESYIERERVANDTDVLKRLMGFDISEAQATLEQLAYEMKNLYYDADLESYEEYTLRKLELQDKYNKASEAKIKAEIKSWKSLATGLTSLFGTMQSIYEEDLKNKVENGKLTDEEAERRFESTKKFQYATAVISMLAGASGIFMDTMKDHTIQPTYLRAGLAAVQYAGVLATGIQQIQQIKNATFSSSSGASGGGGASGITMASVSPLLDQGLDQNSYTQLNAESNSQQQDQRVYIVESDIEKAGNRASVRETASTF